jgi:hypothetical protein
VASPGDNEIEDAGLSEDGPEPLEYLFLDFPDLPDGLVEKIKSDWEMHEMFIEKLLQRNKKLRRLARLRSEAPTEGSEVNGSSSSTATQEACKRAAAEAYEAHMTEKLTRTCQQAKARIASMTRHAGQAEEATRKKQIAGKLERARMHREIESTASEVTSTQAHISDLEAEIHLQLQKFRDKDAERKEVAREVEALRCEARAHRTRAGKHVQTKQRIEAVSRQLEATRASLEQHRVAC